MPSIRKRGKVWNAQVRVKGVAKSGTFKTKGEAQAWAVHTESEILAGTAGIATRMTVGDALIRYMEEVTPKRKSHQIETKHIKFLLNTLPFVDKKLSDLETDDVAKWRDSRLKTVKNGTVLRNISLLGSVFSMARTEWKWISENPIRDLKKPQSPNHREAIYSDPQIAALVAVLPETICAMFLFALETAMRRGEMIGLEWEMINMDRRYLTLPDTKNGEKRDVPLSSKAIEILQGRAGNRKPFSINIETFGTQFRKAKADAGITGLTFHDTRATALTRLSKKLSVLELARMIGHRDLKSLQIYYRESAENLAKLLD